MRIISTFHDYYDGVQSLGYDPGLIYIREPRDLVYRDNNLVNSRLFNREFYFNFGNKNIHFRFMLVGFCGNIFPLIIFQSKYYCYSIEDADIAIKKINMKEVYNKYMGKSKKYIFTPELSRKRMSNFFNKNYSDWLVKVSFHETERILNSLAIEHKVPIFIFGYNYNHGCQTLTLNCNLQSINFQRIKDAYTTYQEIAQHLSGVLGQNDKPTIQISDKDMRDKKGFDEWSFKKKGDNK